MRQLQIIIFMLFGVLSTGYAYAGNDGRNLVVTQGGAKRIALVIGNDNYQHVDPLKNAVFDARSIAQALQEAGFTVMLKLDVDLSSMKQAVRQFKASLAGGDEAIFFYSGHGVQLGSANYLLPVDINGDSAEQVRDDSIPLQRLLDDLQDQKVKFALAIIDACRDDPFKGNGRGIGGTRGLAPTNAANGQMVIFSAGSGQQALDKLGNADTNKNGVFTRVFLQEMQKHGIEIHQVLRNVRSRVVQMAKSVNHDQMPALYDQAEGDFYFYDRGVPGVGSEPVQAPETAGISLEDIKKQQDARAQWEKWQRAMKADFDKIAALNVEPDLLSIAWERFLSGYKQDNPYSEEARQLRMQAQSRLQAAKEKLQQASTRTEPAGHGRSVSPYIADANTVLLDHFDGVTTASVLAYSENNQACGTAKPSARPAFSFVNGVAGLDQTLMLNPPAGQPFGSATYLKYPDGQLLSKANGTIEFWVYLTGYGQGISLVDQGPYYGSCAGWTFGMGVNAAGQLTAGAWAAFDMNSGSTTVPLNTWTHVAASWGKSGAKLYINGVQVGKDANTGMPAGGYGGSLLIRLGSHSQNGVRIDELRVSDIQRSITRQ